MKGRLLEVTYEEFINNILETRGRNGCGEEYHETHHIVPKCMGGSNDEDNLIDLFAREHFEAHRQLALENPENEKLTYAWWCMSVQTNEYTKERYKITAEEYEEARKFCSNIRSKSIIGKNNPNYGHRWSDDQKKKLSNLMSGKNGSFYGKRHTEETKTKIRESNKGKIVSDETRRKISESRIGEKNPIARAVTCIETGETLWGAKAFQDKYGFYGTNITRCCRGKKKTAYGYHWRYTDEL